MVHLTQITNLSMQDKNLRKVIVKSNLPKVLDLFLENAEVRAIEPLHQMIGRQQKELQVWTLN